SAHVLMPLTLDLDQTGKVEWIGSDGSWGTAGKTNANWSTNVVPLSTQDVVIGTPLAGDITVTSSSSVSINSLRVGSNVTLAIAGSSFAINAADQDPFLNEGTVSIRNGGSFSVGNTQNPDQSVVNSGTFLVANGSATFISAIVTNTGGTIEIDD